MVVFKNLQKLMCWHFLESLLTFQLFFYNFTIFCIFINLTLSFQRKIFSALFLCPIYLTVLLKLIEVGVQKLYLNLSHRLLPYICTGSMMRKSSPYRRMCILSSCLCSETLLFLIKPNNSAQSAHIALSARKKLLNITPYLLKNSRKMNKNAILKVIVFARLSIVVHVWLSF